MNARRSFARQPARVPNYEFSLNGAVSTKTPWTWLGLVCAFALAVSASVAADVPLGVAAAASNGLPAFLAKVPSSSKQLYGFPAEADLTKASLGLPVQFQALKPTALSSNQVDGTVSSVASETSMWFFPVLMEGEVRAMLVVDRQSNEWKAVSFGYAALASEWNQVLQQWPPTKGFHPRLVGAFRVALYYFTIPEAGDRNLTPLLVPRDASLLGSSPPYGSGQSPNQYSALSTCASEMAALKARLKKSDFRTGRQP